MSFAPNGDGPPSDDRWFAIVPTSADGPPLDVFRAIDWIPAIETYLERVRSKTYRSPVSLRRARPPEINGHGNGTPEHDTLG
jgi:hypothetical protein